MSDYSNLFSSGLNAIKVQTRHPRRHTYMDDSPVRASKKETAMHARRITISTTTTTSSTHTPSRIERQYTHPYSPKPSTSTRKPARLQIPSTDNNSWSRRASSIISPATALMDMGNTWCQPAVASHSPVFLTTSPGASSFISLSE